MLTLGHLFVGLLLLWLYPFIGNAVFVVILASLLIDIDHIQILIKEKAYTPSKIRRVVRKVLDKYYKNPKKAFKGYYFVFHSLEFLFLLSVVSIFYKPLMFVAGGMIFHVITDAIHHEYYHLPVANWLIFTPSLIKIIKEND
jgi:hypothetical protein